MSRKLPPSTDWVRSFVQYSDNTEPPALFREWCAVSTIAAALQRKCRLSMGTRTLFPNLYVVLVAPAGRARKGTAMSLSRPFLEMLDIPLAAEATTREALIKRLREAEIVTPSPSAPLIHSSLTIFSPELTVFLGYNNLQLLSDLTDWFDCAERWQYRTKNSGIEDIRGVFVNILGATTPDLIRTALPQDAVGGGLTSRVIFVYCHQKGKLVPFPFLSKEDEKLGKDLAADLHTIHQLQGDFKMTNSFMNRYSEWYASSEVEQALGPHYNKVFDGYIERRSTHLLKLCMVMSAARSNELSLEVVDWERAYTLLTTTEKSMSQAFGGYGSSEKAGVLHAIQDVIREGAKTPQEILLRTLYDSGSMDTVAESLRTLTSIGLVEGQGGKYRMADSGGQNSDISKPTQE